MYIPALGAFFVAVALVVAGCGSGLSGNSVATVAGNSISTRAFNHWMYVDAKGQSSQQGASTPVIVPNDPPNFPKCVSEVRAEIPSLKKTATKTIRADCTQLFTSLKSQVMDFLIKAYWYQAEAHKLGVKLTPAQIQTALAAAKKGQFATPAAYQTFLKTSGYTSDDILYRVRVNQVFEKLLHRYPTTVTPAAIDAYYTKHVSSFGSPQRRNLRIVLAKTAAKAEAAKSALEHGQSWNVVAKKYSTDPTTKDKGGVLPDVTAGQQDAALSKAAFAAPVNKLRGPVKGQFGYYVLEVTKITKATQQTLAQATPSIKSTLTTQLATKAQTAVDAQAKKDWFKKTTCRAEYSMADCSGYKAPKTSTTAAAGASGAAGTAASGATATTSP